MPTASLVTPRKSSLDPGLQMPTAKPTTYIASKNGQDYDVQIMERRANQVYVHFRDTDKRLDTWLPASDVHERAPSPGASTSATASLAMPKSNGTRKRRRSSSPTSSQLETQPLTARSSLSLAQTQEIKPDITEEEFDIQHHKQITARRNFDKVNFGTYQIKTWYFSPYPLSETEADTEPVTAERIAGVARATFKSHGRTSDLLAGGLGRDHATGERSVLWVCDRCFKYMADGTSWEGHMRKCGRKNPPGRKVYQRGAHTIWEVDGAKEKLYCQNLSLFGKLFIDIKTLFFDCDNFLFYILTDADSQRDHVLGFFSKEKVSYDDYNLATIIVLPPYQRKGYGMLMIEFSYELSRRTGRVGTPERPLSDLGLRSYLTYWVATIIRFLRRLLSVLPPDMPKLITVGRSQNPATLHTLSADFDDLYPRQRKKRITKGFDGEVDTPESTTSVSSPPEPNSITSLRTVETIAHPDGSATTNVILRCTLADLARATNLRVEDAAFALNECGLLMQKVAEGEASGQLDAGETVVITREMVETVAKMRKVKKMCMDLAHVLL